MWQEVQASIGSVSAFANGVPGPFGCWIVFRLVAAWWHSWHLASKGSAPFVTTLWWTLWQLVQPLPPSYASPQVRKELLYFRSAEKSNLPVAISLHFPTNLACGLLRNWLLCGWLGKATVEWYGPTSIPIPLPVS